MRDAVYSPRTPSGAGNSPPRRGQIALPAAGSSGFLLQQTALAEDRETFRREAQERTLAMDVRQVQLEAQEALIREREKISRERDMLSQERLELAKMREEFSKDLLDRAKDNP